MSVGPVPDAPRGWQDWTFGLLEGSGGALIGLVGLFAVFLLTRRHDRQRDRADRADQRLQRWESRRDELLAGVVDASRMFSGQSSLAAHRDDCYRMSSALLLLSLHLISEDRDVADWALAESRAFTTLAHERGDVRAASWEAGNLAGILMHWRSGDRPHADFRALAARVREQFKRGELSPEKAAADLAALEKYIAAQPEHGDLLAGTMEYLRQQSAKSEDDLEHP